ncbi:MAG: agmatinase, partial [Pseudomonadota bacterium]
MHDPFEAGPCRASRKAGLFLRKMPRRHHHPDFDKLNMRGWKAAEKEGTLPSAAWQQERAW